MPLFVLDTSAILCLLYQEDGYERVREILDRARGATGAERLEVLVPFIALMEIEYRLARQLSPAQVDQMLVLIDNWPITVAESDVAWRHAAARLKATVTLSVADAWIASLAELRSGILVHKDPEFDHLPGLQVVRLPYRRPGP